MKTIAFGVVSAVLGGALTQVLIDTEEAQTAAPSATRQAPPPAKTVVDAAEADSVAQTRRSYGPGLLADAIVRVAATDPEAAMQQALAIEHYWLRRDTAERIAVVWAERSPAAALSFVREFGELLGPGTLSAVRARILATWAAVDSARALQFLLSREGQDLFFLDREAARQFARDLATREASDILAVADTLPKGLVRVELLDAAMQSLVDRDVASAARQAGLEAPGPMVRQWIRHIEEPFARTDPEAAFEWAEGIETRFPGTLRRVSRLVRQLHPDRTEEFCEFDPGIDANC